VNRFLVTALLSLSSLALAEPTGRRFALDTYGHLGELRSAPSGGGTDALRQLSLFNVGFAATTGERWLLRVNAGSIAGMIGPHVEGGLGAEYHLTGPTRSGVFARAGLRGIAGVGIVCVDDAAACEAERLAVRAYRLSYADAIGPTAWAALGELGVGGQLVTGRLAFFAFGSYQAGSAFPLGSPAGISLRSGFYQGWLATLGARLFL
jgi:hypothetical protein